MGEERIRDIQSQLKSIIGEDLKVLLLKIFVEKILVREGFLTSTRKGDPHSREQFSVQCVSYKWISRHFDIPANHAKQILFQFAEAHKKKVSVTYLLAGWTREGQQHTFQILGEEDVQVFRIMWKQPPKQCLSGRLPCLFENALGLHPASDLAIISWPFEYDI